MAKKQKQPSATITTIKGYLPIRLSLPPLSNAPPLSTFIFIKEHISKQSNSSSSSTLFVANAPANGPIRTDLYLHAVFERYGVVERVTVASNPRDSTEKEEDVELFRTASLGFDNDINRVDNEKGDGKFAHVVFANGKEMKRAIKAVKEDVETNGMVILTEEILDGLLRQTELLRRQANQDAQNDEQVHKAKQPSGIHAIAAQYAKSSYRHMTRSQLMDLCNTTMTSYEQSEAEASARAKRLAEEPDEDGFITVTHNSSTPTFGVDLLESTQHPIGRSKGSKRNRKRKAENRHGGGEFSDFYKFQWKEVKRREMNDLKARFEEDLEKVKRMKEERAFRPF
jgi:ribosomal RNA-processing protein 7